MPHKFAATLALTNALVLKKLFTFHVFTAKLASHASYSSPEMSSLH